MTGLSPCIKTAVIPIPLALHSISKVSAKLGKANKGSVLNFSFSKLKAFSCSLVHLKPTFFLMHSVNGAAEVEKF